MTVKMRENRMFKQTTLSQTVYIQTDVESLQSKNNITSDNFFTYIIPEQEYVCIFNKLFSLDPIFAEAFPELEGSGIKIKITGEKWCGACYDFTQKAIRFSGPNNIKSSLETLCQIMFHELTHALQYLTRDIPYGERSADVYCITRLPIWIIRDAKNFSYISIPSKVKSDHPKEVKQLAKEAITKRSQGLRNYLVWFESEVNKLKDAHLNGGS